jgi:hypothetical protein
MASFRGGVRWSLRCLSCCRLWPSLGWYITDGRPPTQPTLTTCPACHGSLCLERIGGIWVRSAQPEGTAAAEQAGKNRGNPTP